MADPAAIRFNNPGAMWPGASSKLFGATSYATLNDGQKNRIAQFPDAESGAAAQFDLLKRGYAGMTLADAIMKWSGKNSPGEYTNYVSQNAGIPANAVLTPELLGDPTRAVPIAKAMAAWEAGRRDKAGRLIPYPMADDQWNSAHKRFLGGPQTASTATPQNYDMYGENVKPSPAPITTGSIQPQGRQMPQDPVTGAWTPEEVIKSRYGTANQFWDTRKASTPIGAIAEGLGGFFGMREKGAADDLVRQNQAVQQEALRRAAGAGSTDALARSMIASGIPQLGEQGVGILGKNLSAEEARNTPQARAQLAAQEQALKTAQQAYAHQEQMHPVEQDLKRAQAEQARRKDVLQRYKEKILFGEDDAEPTAGVKPMSDQAPLPSVPGVTLVSDKPQVPAIDESKLTPNQWFRLQAKRDPQWAINYLSEQEKNPSKAQEMWDQRRGKLTTGTKTKLEENLSGLVNMRGNLAQVAGQFKPEFLQVSNQAQQWWNAVRDKTGIEKFKLDPEEKSKLTEFAKFRSSSIGVLNARLKELSGAAVTESEYRRIAAELPNPGTGIADGDSPTQFKAKMDSVLRMANLGIARTHYLVRNGFSGSVEEAEKQMPLDAVPQKMNEVGNQILQELKIKNPGVADDKLIPQARQEVAKQFGISI